MLISSNLQWMYAKCVDSSYGCQMCVSVVMVVVFVCRVGCCYVLVW